MSELNTLLEGLPQVFGALILALLAMVISRWQRLDLEKDMLVAIVRAFVQLMAIGLILEWIFAVDKTIFVLLAILFMVLVAGYTAGRRARLVPNSTKVATVAIAVGTALTIVLLVLLQVFPFEPRFIIPIAGMVVGNAMVVTVLVMTRLRDDIKLQRPQIEAALALGATPKQASELQLRRALATGMMPIIENTKTVGLISLPGAMTGMILGGVSPLQAVQVQAIVMYMLIGAAAFSGMTAIFLSQPQFFTSSYQIEAAAIADET